MSAHVERQRLLLVASAAVRDSFNALFASGLAEGWELAQADSFEQARVLQQHDPCAILLIDHSLYTPSNLHDPAWLSSQREASVVFLAGDEPDILTAALEHGACSWLPRDLALSHPILLMTVLNRAARQAGTRQRTRLLGEALRDCRRQVRDLVTLLWGMSPIEMRTRWFTQQHILERLQEEISRSERHGESLSVVVGAVHTASNAKPPSDTTHLTAWTAERIIRNKRRTDVAGQYGPGGFLLLLPHTTEAGAIVCCQRLRNLIETGPGHAALPPGRVCVAFGISTYSKECGTAQSLLGSAEEALERFREAHHAQGPA
jgi:diguanylate cyclase (GGDEF)-like protein